MMSSEQTKQVREVYLKFMASEERGWSPVDEYLEMLEYIDDHQLYLEASVLFESHQEKKIGCLYKHKKSNCFVPTIMEAVDAILTLYSKTETMHKNNRYILQYYLALSQAGQIVELIDSQGHNPQ